MRKLSIIVLNVFIIFALVTAGANCAGNRRATVDEVVNSAGAQEKGTKVSWLTVEDPSDEDDIIDARDGQWAASGKASSSMADLSDMPKASAGKAAGPPDVEEHGVGAGAWGPSMENAGLEWLEMDYANPVHATGVYIRETNGCGAVVMVQLRDVSGDYHVKYKGKDKDRKSVLWFILEFPPTDYLVDGVRITLDTTLVPHWKMIDSVQLAGF
ncbi:MAG: hypothetical protein JW738_03285 [Actinobacteria bacterium]|nr:hypothetical protein [Actinomycetota bacterium]